MKSVPDGVAADADGGRLPMPAFVSWNAARR